MAEDDKDTARDDEESSSSKDEQAPADKGGREGMILKGIIVVALLGGAGYIGSLYHATSAGDPCTQSWHCKSPDGQDSAQCRNVVGRGNICVLGCSKDESDGCPDGFACDQLVWDEGGVQTGWFCLPKKTVP